MDAMEIEGKTIDEAIENACSAFRVPREKLNIEILSEGSAGFLGLGSKKARIRASLLNIDLTFETRTAGTEPRNRTPKGSPPPQRSSRTPVRIQPEAAVPAPPAAPGSPADPCPPPSPAASTDNRAPERARLFLEGLLSRMQLPSPVTVRETAESIVLNIEGDGSGLLIGKRGQNLDAIQYIVNKAIHHSANGNRMIVIDTESYRKRREEALIALAMRAAEKARKHHKPVTIGHMNAHDRRIIHLAVQNDATLTTRSRGEGEYRSILILAARRGTEPAED
jgi:spoIIIJ-associated protein